MSGGDPNRHKTSMALFNSATDKAKQGHSKRTSRCKFFSLKILRWLKSAIKIIMLKKA